MTIPATVNTAKTNAAGGPASDPGAVAPNPAQALALALQAIPTGPLTEQSLALLRPHFAHALRDPSIYLATHSMGRPPDAALAAFVEYTHLWTQKASRAWPVWLKEREHYRASLATLLGAARADSIIPRTSAGAALRTVLQTLPQGAHVLTTSDEFDSIQTVLGLYAQAGRIRLTALPLTANISTDLAAQVRRDHPALVIVSHVFFTTGQVTQSLPELAQICRAANSRLLIDTYHSLGAIPLNVGALGCDYAIGGCYKYLRGGPGAAFLYVAPIWTVHNLQPVDSGWFALAHDPQPGVPPSLLPGGDALLEDTPAVAAWYQARAGLALTQALGVDRIRAYALTQLTALQRLLAHQGIKSQGATPAHGAFLTIASEHAHQAAKALTAQGVITNARRNLLRLTPDLLTTTEELRFTAAAVSQALPTA